MNITGSLAAGITITFTTDEKDILKRGLRRELRRLANDGATVTPQDVFTETIKTAISSFVLNAVRDADRSVPLTDAERSQIDAVVAAAAERDVADVPLT